MEPPRNPVGPVSVSQTVNAKCCGFCCEYGNTTVTLNCSKNFVHNGETVQISGQINNTQGSQ